MIKVYVHPDKKSKSLDYFTYTPMYDHMSWCRAFCQGEWYNESDDYSYVCFTNSKDAFYFAQVFAPFKDEQEELWYKLKWL